MRIYLLTVLLMTVAFLAPSGAEFYEYKDAKGHLHFTDDLSDVPEDQRFNLTASQEIPLEKSDANSIDERIIDPITTESAPDGREGKLQDAAKKLEEEQGALDRVYEALKAEKQELGDPPPVAAKLAEKTAYQARVEELNRKIAEYEEQRKQFEEKVAAFITNGLHDRH